MLGCLRPVLAALGLLLLPGCFQARYAYDGPKLLTTADSLGTEASVVRRFEAHDRGFYWLFGRIPHSEPVNGAELAAREVGEHDGAINLRFSDGQDLVDAFVSQVICVFGVLCGSWSVWAEGDVVDLVGPPETAWVGAPDTGLAQAETPQPPAIPDTPSAIEEAIRRPSLVPVPASLPEEF